MKKNDIKTLAAKRRTAEGIVAEIDRLDTFILAGHKDPDIDCIASMLTMSLLLRKAKKDAVIYLPGPVAEHFNYLVAICKAQGVMFLYGGDSIPVFLSSEKRLPGTAIVILDTPKPEMMSINPAIFSLIEKNIRRIEIDHHLEGDANYAGDEGFCLVGKASSTCELLCYLGYKMARHFGWEKDSDILSRNIYLAILTGIIGDSNMGRYLKTRREKWYYETVNERFHAILGSVIPKNTEFSTDNMFDIIYTFSVRDRRCFDEVMQLVRETPAIHYIAIPLDVSERLIEKYGIDRLVTVAKVAADTLAERSGKLGMIAYQDDKNTSSFAQFRLRRSSIYSGIDLRTALEKLKIGNGGGHPGAIGFRVPGADVKDIETFTAALAEKVEKMLPQERK